jgi:hypothetical protein
MNTAPAVKRSNRLLLLAMVCFAVVLFALCLVWMYFRMKRAENGVLSGSHQPAQIAPHFSAALAHHLPPVHFHLVSR